tara:strand:- start:13503 stop:18338 length:4836 start_codon:yes stop_codon:yes gene_type:complete
MDRLGLYSAGNWLSLRAMAKASTSLTPILVSLMLLILDASIAVSGNEWEMEEGEATRDSSEIDIVGTVPPLVCDGQECPIKDRTPYLPPNDVEWPVQEPGWWFDFWNDKDGNGMDDRLQWIISGERDSVSTSAIMGADGRMTVAIFVCYSWHPDESDVTRLKEVLSNHGWDEYETYFRTVDILDTIIVEHVPVSSLIDILMLEGVVLVEQQDVLVPYLNTATKGSKVRASDVFSETMMDYGYDGSGVVIAIADTGVDNEHFSLDDFSDDNTDNEAEPDELPDPKWVAGCDSTSWNQQDCDDGGDDPDDGDGHGTHVAGIALGTGGPNRENQGYAPGAYLVDIKVMTDAGASNSGYTVAGINWAVQNVDTDWGNNDSSRGIDILSMSFGSGSNPAGGEDPGDNGTSQDSLAVNAASEAGIVCVAAIGNDGYRRVTSVGAADSAITVGSIDDKASIERGDDSISSFSNSGPREDDGDDNEWDELKPDIVGPGSNIMSAQHAASSSSLPGSAKPLASDNYVQKSGTSMSTPAVAGFIAAMLQMDDDLTPQEVKDILRNNSETRGGASAPDITDRWNDQYGFGIIDGEMVMQAILGDNGGGGNGNGTDPPPTGTEEWVIIETPEEDSWLVEGETYSVRGQIDEDADTNGTIEEVNVSISYRYRPDEGPRQTAILVDWHIAQGTLNWSTPFTIPEFTEDEVDIEDIIIKAKARNEFNVWSEMEQSEHPVGLVEVSLGGPSGQSPVSGNTNIFGGWESVNGGEIQWRLGTDEWDSAEQFGGTGSSSGDWSVNWDTTSVNDGFYRISVRVVSGDGIFSEEVRRTVEVDNDPPAPDLIFRSGISISEYGLPVSETYVNTFLEVSCEVRNDGDLDATEVTIYLKENGARKDELVIPSIGSGDIVEIILYWNPLNLGERSLTVSLDPTNEIDEIDEGDNEQTVEFPVLERPQGVDLSFREGAVRTEPPVPRPNEQFLITARVDNLGSSDARDIEATLEIRNSIGWEAVSSSPVTLVMGQGSSQISFAHLENSSGPVNLRISVTGASLSDLDWSNNMIQSTILIDETTLTGPRTASFSTGEVPVELVQLTDEGGVVITNKDDDLRLYRLGSNKALTACSNVLEEKWSGDIVAVSSDDGLAHVVWTRRYLDNLGFFQQTVSYTTIDSSCLMTPIQDIMDPILLSDGKYWGIGMDIDGPEILVAGYHHEINPGSYNDNIAVFMAKSESPTKSTDWIINPQVVGNLDVVSGVTDPVAVGLGDEDGHILYQDTRNDSTGIDRLGLWYSHGLPEQTSWSYRKSIGDYSFAPVISVSEISGEEVIVASWGEGYDQDSELVTVIVDSSFLPIGDGEVRTPARGLSYIQLLETNRGVQLFFDFVGPSGPQMQYGMINPEEGWVGISDRLGLGRIVISSRSPIDSDAVILQTSPTGWQIRALVDDSSPEKSKGTILDQVREYTGLDERNFNVILIGISGVTIVLSLIVILTMATRAIHWASGKSRKKVTGSVILEEDVVDVIEETDIPIRSSDVELVEENSMPETRASSDRRRRREYRSKEGSVLASLPEIGGPVGISPPVPKHLPPSPIPASTISTNRRIACQYCESIFEVEAGVSRSKCPVCGEKIELV